MHQRRERDQNRCRTYQRRALAPRAVAVRHARRGSGPQLAIELFALKTKIKVQHIPFRGSAPAVTELLAGRLDFMMDPAAGLVPHVRSGKLNALAVSSGKRFFALPQVPTVAESGVPGFNVAAWQGLVGPAGLPAPIVMRLNTEVVRLLKQPATIETLHAFGNEPAPTTPEEFRKRLADDIAIWTTVADEIHFEKIERLRCYGTARRPPFFAARWRAAFAAAPAAPAGAIRPVREPPGAIDQRRRILSRIAALSNSSLRSAVRRGLLAGGARRSAVAVARPLDPERASARRRGQGCRRPTPVQTA